MVLDRGPLVEAILASCALPGIFIQLYKRIGALSARGDGTLDAADDEVEQKVGLGLWADRLRQRLGREAEERPNGLELVQRALDIMMAQLEGYRLQTYRPDVLIVPQVGSLGFFSFSQEKEHIFQAGAEAAERRADDLALLARQLGGGP